MLLIDERPWRLPPPQRPAWEPNWRVWSWVLAAVATIVGASVTGGFASLVFVLLAVACVAQAANRALPYRDGLREYRQ